MTPIGNLTQAASQHRQQLSQVEPTANRIPVEKQRAMGDVFDRWRLNQGWNPWDNDTQNMAISSWVHSLDREGVPAGCYSELYENALVTRARALQNGKSIPQFGVELMLACWPALRDELKQREIDAGRTLPDTAASQCPRCFGTGFEHVYADNGQKIGARNNCDHRPLVECEWLFEQRAKSKESNVYKAEFAA